MIAYHIDRTNTLFAGQVLTLTSFEALSSELQTNAFIRRYFQDGLSRHGVQYAEDSTWAAYYPYTPQAIIDGINYISQRVMEFNLESIRRISFPHLLSRYQAFFALENLTAVDSWPDLISGNHQVLKVEISDSSISLDSSLLRCGLASFVDSKESYCVGLSPNIVVEHAVKYWSGELSETPRLELLAPFPVKIPGKL